MGRASHTICVDGRHNIKWQRANTCVIGHTCTNTIMRKKNGTKICGLFVVVVVVVVVFVVVVVVVAQSEHTWKKSLTSKVNLFYLCVRLVGYWLQLLGGRGRKCLRGAWLGSCWRSHKGLQQPRIGYLLYWQLHVTYPRYRRSVCCESSHQLLCIPWKADIGIPSLWSPWRRQHKLSWRLTLQIDPRVVALQPCTSNLTNITHYRVILKGDYFKSKQAYDHKSVKL